MAIRKETPEKYCECCGKKMERSIFTSKMESVPHFLNRKFCSPGCRNAGNIKEKPQKLAITLRCRKFKKDKCENCGSSETLGVHHEDRNRYNNDPKNLKTLCVHCHGKIHWEQDRKRAEPCIVCGSEPHKDGYCSKHYKRFAKYGDPMLTKERVNGIFQIVTAAS